MCAYVCTYAARYSFLFSSSIMALCWKCPLPDKVVCDVSLCLQMPHYNLVEATDAAKKVMGPYYREPETSKGWFPSHLFAPLSRSFKVGSPCQGAKETCLKSK